MARHVPLDDWTREVTAHFPNLSRPQAALLALWSFGIVLTRSCTLSAVATILSPLLGRSFNTVRQRLREWYKPAAKKKGEHRREVEVTTCFAPLLAWILKNWPCPRVALALDATSLADRLTVLSLSLVYRGTAIPVAWKVLPGNQPHAWKPEWLTLLRWFANEIDPSWTVIVMTDRGLYARWLFQAIVALGWHPMMRVTRHGKFRPDGWTKSQEVCQFVPRVGGSWQGRGTAFPHRSQHRLVCTLLVYWAEGHEDGWYVLTDLPPEVASTAWYGLRMWIEHGYKQFKSAGWQWQKTRIDDPDRASRMWLAVALATLWAVAVGGKHDHGEEPQETMPHLPGTKPRNLPQESAKYTRRVSVLKQGIAVILVLIMEHHIPRPERWYPEPWPTIQTTAQSPDHQQAHGP